VDKGEDSSTLKINLLFHSVDKTLLLKKSLFIYNDLLHISALTPQPSSENPMGCHALGYFMPSPLMEERDSVTEMLRSENVLIIESLQNIT